MHLIVTNYKLLIPFTGMQFYEFEMLISANLDEKRKCMKITNTYND